MGVIDDLLSLLPLLVIFIALANKFTKVKEDVRGEGEEEPKLGDFDSRGSYEVEERYSTQTTQTLEEESGLDRKIIEEKKRRVDSNRISRNKRRSAMAMKVSNLEEVPVEKSFIGGDDLKEDLLRGVVFKEILDRPRAKRPYNPPRW